MASDVTVETLEQAIGAQVAANVDQATKRAAMEYCEQVRSSTDGWKRALEFLFATEIVNVKFFCLSVLEQFIVTRYRSASVDELAQLRNGLLAWLCDYVPSSPNEDSAIKNKFSQVLMMVFWLEYPRGWPDFFAQLFRLVDGSVVVGGGAPLDHNYVIRVDMLLRVLLAIDNDIVSRRNHRNQEDVARIGDIKDAMREDCVQQCIGLCFAVIGAYADPMVSQTVPGAAVAVSSALDVLKRYVVWVDIELVVGGERAHILTSLLRLPEQRIGACDTIAETVAKGMPAHEKLLLISRLRLKSVVLDVLRADAMTTGEHMHSPLRKSRASGEAAFLASLGAIVNRMGVELCQSYDALRRLAAEAGSGGGAAQREQSAKEALDDLVQLLVQFLASPDVDVSLSVFEFCGEYLSKLRRTPGELSARRVEHLGALLSVLSVQLRYPDGYNHKRAPDEFEQRFDEYRDQIDVHTRNAARLRPELLAAGIESALAALLASGASVAEQPYNEVERVLHLIYICLEGARDDAHAQLAPHVPRWLGELLVRGVALHPHHAVLRKLFECATRHARPLAALALPPDGAPALLVVLQALLDERGMRAAGSDRLTCELRQRAAASFARLSRTLRSELHAHTDALLQACAPLLTIDSGTPLSFSGQLSLFEALGLLLGQSTQRVEPVHKIFGMLLDGMKALLANDALRGDTAQADIGCSLLAQHINAISSLTKGFSLVTYSTSSAPNDAGNSSSTSSGHRRRASSGSAQIEVDEQMRAAYGDVLLAALDAVLAARCNAAHSEEVRSAANTNLHCMVDSLGVLVLSRLSSIVEACGTNATPHNLIEFTRLLCQLINRFGERVREPLEQLLLPLLEQLLAAVRATAEMAAQDSSTSAGAGRSEVSREAGELRRAYYSLLQAIASSSAVVDALRSSALAGALEGILNTLLDGIGADDDHAVQRSSSLTLSHLVRRWLEHVGPPPHSPPSGVSLHDSGGEMDDSARGSTNFFGTFVWQRAVPAGIAAAVRLCVAQHSVALAASAASAADAQLASGRGAHTHKPKLDATAALAVQDAATVQALLVQAHGDDALRGIGERAVALGCDPEVTRQFVVALGEAVRANADVRTMRQMVLALAEATAQQVLAQR